MQDDLPPDDSDDVLEKVDALLKKHQSGGFSAPRPAPTAQKAAPAEDFDDIPVLTDIVETAPASGESPAEEALLNDLEERLQRELEARLAPQLSQAFHHILTQFLEEAKLEVRLAVREHFSQEQEHRRAQHGENKPS